MGFFTIQPTSQTPSKRDYRFKRAEYASFGIPEYWIVDLLVQKVTILRLVEGLYEEAQYQGTEPVRSETFPSFALTVKQIL